MKIDKNQKKPFFIKKLVKSDQKWPFLGPFWGVQKGPVFRKNGPFFELGEFE